MESLVAKQLSPPRVGMADSGVADDPRRWRFARSLALVVLVVGGLLALARYSDGQLDQRPATAEEEPVYLPDVRFLLAASLGYSNALADVLWFRAIDYFGKHFRGDRLYPWLAHMCDVVTDLDPRAEHVYRFGGFILPWEAEMPDQGLRLLEKGVAQFPDSWQLHYYLGFSRFYFRNDIAGALPELRRAAELPDAHPYVTQLIATLYSQQYGAGSAREFLEELRDSGTAGGMENIIQERLKDVDLSEHIALLEDGVRRFREKFGREPADLEDLPRAGIITAIPAEPSGGSYVYDPASHEVRSTSGRRPLRVHDSERRRQVLNGESYRN